MRVDGAKRATALQAVALLAADLLSVLAGQPAARWHVLFTRFVMQRLLLRQMLIDDAIPLHKVTTAFKTRYAAKPSNGITHVCGFERGLRTSGRAVE